MLPLASPGYLSVQFLPGSETEPHDLPVLPLRVYPLSTTPSSVTPGLLPLPGP